MVLAKLKLVALNFKLGAIAPPQIFTGEAEFLGVGAAIVKSAALLLLSVHPLSFLIAAVVLDKIAVAAVPSKQLAVGPKPTKSMMLLPVGQDAVMLLVSLTNTTFPAVPLIFVEPTTSAVGKGVVPPAPAACCIK